MATPTVESLKPKVCLTASGALVHEGKIMLIKHKKLQIWLCPGGHMEENEMPHQAAEREFLEETGIKVRAVRIGFFPELPADEAKNIQFLPVPLATNLHFVSRENYEHRVNGTDVSVATAKKWKKGCEAHVDQRFLVEPVEGVDFKRQIEEIDGIGWFAEDEIDELQTYETIKLEIHQAFEVASQV
jgi:8-oxo-dGTP diphosphatase